MGENSVGEQKKDTMQILKTGLILILALLLNVACKPYLPALQANSNSIASMSGVAQQFPATPTITTDPSQAEVSTPNSSTGAATENNAVESTESELDTNPESSFPLAPNTQWDPGNGESGEKEGSGAFSLHSKDTIEDVNQFYQTALPSQGWQLRYIDMNHMGGITQYWKLGMLYLSLDFSYDQTGLAIQAQWHQVDPEYAQLLPKEIPFPNQAYLVDATDTTWQVYIPLEIKESTEYFQQKAAALNWKPNSVPEGGEVLCVGDCANQTSPSYLPGVTPMPTATPDPRPPQALVYTMTNGNEITLAFQPHQDSTILNITLTMKNVESAGLPRELPIYPGATGMVIAPGMVRFTVPQDLKTTVQFYINSLTGTGWQPNAGYSLDTAQLYFQEWDKGQLSFRLHISSPESSPQSSTVSIQCLQCAMP